LDEYRTKCKVGRSDCSEGQGGEKKKKKKINAMAIMKSEPSKRRDKRWAIRGNLDS